MEQNPSSEANSHSISQAIHRLFLNRKVYYRIFCKNPPHVPNLIQKNPVHTLTNYVYVYVYVQVSSIHLFKPKLCINFSSTDACYITRQSHSP